MRVAVNTTLNKDLYKQVQILALELSTHKNKVCANDLIEQGMKLLLEQYKHKQKDIEGWMKVNE